VVPACSPSYSGGRDQSQPGQKVRETLSQKTLHKNRAGGVAQGEGPEFKPQCLKKICNELKRVLVSWAWWCTPVISALTQGDFEFKANLSYITSSRPA
jgi:hypothetical protein